MPLVSGNKHRRRGRRAGSSIKTADIHSRLDGRPAGTHCNHSHNVGKQTTVTGIAESAAKYYECSVVEETTETHIVPRRSITRKQMLDVFPAKIETEPIRGKQYDHRLGVLVEVNDNRVVSRSDRTLLQRGKPVQDFPTLQREGSVSMGLNKRKTIKTEKEVPASELELTDFE